MTPNFTDPNPLFQVKKKVRQIPVSIVPLQVSQINFRDKSNRQFRSKLHTNKLKVHSFGMIQIQDHSGHGSLKKPMNPFWARIHGLDESTLSKDSSVDESTLNKDS